MVDRKREPQDIVCTGVKRIPLKLFLSDRSVFDRVRNVLQSLRQDPFQGKALKHKLKGKYSLRVGTYRIIYQIDKKIITVYILDIGHRKEIYQ